MKVTSIDPGEIRGGTHKMWSLPAHLDVPSIMEAMKVRDQGAGDKTSHEWFFQVVYEGAVYQCAIWDYKGARWSAYGSFTVLSLLGLMPQKG